MKACTKCGQEKPLNEFYKKKKGKHGVSAWCKGCSSSYYKGYREKNKGRLSEYYKEWRENNKENLSDYKRKWHKDNLDKIRKNRKSNKERTATIHNEYMKNRRNIDSLFRLAQDIRARIGIAFRKQGYTKKSQTYEMLGCTFEELKTHLEEQFTEGMSWENRREWHIDHIVPLSSASTEEELMELCHFTNLQPLWAEENLKKGSTVL